MVFFVWFFNIFLAFLLDMRCSLVDRYEYESEVQVCRWLILKYVFGGLLRITDHKI